MYLLARETQGVVAATLAIIGLASGALIVAARLMERFDEALEVL